MPGSPANRRAKKTPTASPAAGREVGRRRGVTGEAQSARDIRPAADPHIERETSVEGDARDIVMSDADRLSPRQDARAALADARRIVVKIGSSLLIDPVTRRVARDWLAALASDVATLRDQGREVIVVSSGSIALGRGRLGEVGTRLQDKQAAASVGQSLLMAAWQAAFAPHGLIVGQVLLTRDDTERRRRWLNARATVEALLAHGVVPVVNENDTVATEEIRYGDNDRLAARTAQLARADLLVLLSDVDGLYTGDPRRDPSAVHLPLVDSLSPEVLAMAGGANAEAGVGTGGMAAKLAAAQIARSAGCATVIASGQATAPLSALRDGARATLIAATAMPMSLIPTFAILAPMDQSLNVVTLLALSLTIGILVDDAIVEIENIVRHMRDGKPPYDAAIEAADEIGLAVVATTATIIAVFAPVGFMPGIIGQFFKAFALAACISVFFSLVVARTLTPLMAAYMLKHTHHEDKDPFWMGGYLRALRWSLGNRWKVFVIGILFLVGAIAVLGSTLWAAIPSWSRMYVNLLAVAGVLDWHHTADRMR